MLACKNNLVDNRRRYYLRAIILFLVNINSNVKMTLTSGLKLDIQVASGIMRVTAVKVGFLIIFAAL